MVETVYQIMESRAEAQQAIDRIISTASLQLSVFDQDPAHLRERGFGTPQRIEALRKFLLGNPQRRMTIILHESTAMESEVPRLVTLAGQFSAQVAVRRTVGHAREARDPMVLADRHSVWHHLHMDHPRSVLSINNPDDSQPRADRFDEILDSSEPVSVGSATGL